MANWDDWRLRGQEDYLKNQKFVFQKYSSINGKSLHAHCEFCWHKFMENPEGVEDCSDCGYCSIDNRYWICEDCFADFKHMLNLHAKKK